jgi:hypothetical protein
VVIWLTDNLPNVPYKKGCPVHTELEARWRKAYPPGDAHNYAEATGGQAPRLRGKKPDERLAELIDELRARYTIGYRPGEMQSAGAIRRIRVELAPDGALRPKEWTVLTQGFYRK